MALILAADRGFQQQQVALHYVLEANRRLSSFVALSAS
jgi:hypothetical protein